MAELFPSINKGLTLTSSTKNKQSKPGGKLLQQGPRTLGPCSSSKQRSGVGHSEIRATQRLPHNLWKDLPLPWDGMADEAVCPPKPEH